jgi:Ecdysteroid kinase-like family
VDFQECYFGSPGIDLNHFLYSSCDRHVHEHCIENLLKFYYEHLVAALKSIGFSKIPSYSDIEEEYRKKADQGLIALFSIVPVMMIENPDHANPENFIADGEGAAAIRREVWGNPKYVEVLKYLMPKLAENKVF